MPPRNCAIPIPCESYRSNAVPFQCDAYLCRRCSIRCVSLAVRVSSFPFRGSATPPHRAAMPFPICAIPLRISAAPTLRISKLRFSFAAPSLALAILAMPFHSYAFALRRTAVDGLLIQCDPALFRCLALHSLSFAWRCKACRCHAAALPRGSVLVLRKSRPSYAKALQGISPAVSFQASAIPSTAVPLRLTVELCRCVSYRGYSHAKRSRASARQCYAFPSTPLRCDPSESDAYLWDAGRFHGLAKLRKRNHNNAAELRVSSANRYENVSSEACTSAGAAFCGEFTREAFPARLCGVLRQIGLFFVLRGDNRNHVNTRREDKVASRGFLASVRG